MTSGLAGCADLGFAGTKAGAGIGRYNVYMAPTMESMMLARNASMILLCWFAASAIVTPAVGRMLRGASERSFGPADVAEAPATIGIVRRDAA